ncbi:TPA: hypothetical protein JZE06_000323 [Escherichia coli]|nr:hypothetical protein [Escherichia coli]
MRRLALELKKTFFEIRLWPADELAWWLAHFELEAESEQPPPNKPQKLLTPEESIKQFRNIMG